MKNLSEILKQAIKNELKNKKIKANKLAKDANIKNYNLSKFLSCKNGMLLCNLDSVFEHLGYNELMDLIKKEQNKNSALNNQNK